jgi:NAD(P)-dependent dehydrogenase (short-subunit alcohol dehydrogenase family)
MTYLEELFSLKNKVIVITGGGGVLGGCMAVALAKLGAKIAILDLIEEAGKKVAEEITSAGGQAKAFKANVLEKENLQVLAEKIKDEFGGIDILINGAGGNKKEATTSDENSFFDLPSEALEFVFALNFMGTLLPSQVFGRLMAEQKEGVILNISSMAAFRPLTRVAGYAAAKAAVSNFTAWLAVHIAQNYSPRIRVNAIAPGFFLTEQNRYLLIKEGTKDELTPRGEKIIEHTPLGRFGQPRDLVGAVVWLLSPSADFTTGTVIPIDGGFSAFSGV